MGSKLSKVICCTYCWEKNETKDNKKSSKKIEIDNEAFGSDKQEPYEEPIKESRYVDEPKKRKISRYPNSFSYQVRTEAIREIKLRKTTRNESFFDSQNKTEEKFPRWNSKKPIPYYDKIAEERTLNELDSTQKDTKHNQTTYENSDYQKCYFPSLTQNDCEDKLFSEPPGTYLIRDSENKKNTYVLMVRDDNDEIPVRNFRISVNNRRRVYVSKNESFQDLDDLIIRCTENSGPLRHQLICPLINKNYNEEIPGINIYDDVADNEITSWELNRNELRFLSKIGDGSFGVVWKALWQEKTEIAVKKLKIGNNSVEAFMKEAYIMMDLQHPNILTLYGVVSDQPIFIVTEYMVNGNLSKFLSYGDGRDFNFTQLLDISLQVSSAMRYLEKKELIHCDLRAANVLVGERIVCKVADFGLTRCISNAIDKNLKERFPIRWTAPEVITCLNFTLKSDVWSYGVLLYEIFTKGKRPYERLNSDEILDNLQKGYRLPEPGCFNEPNPQELYQLMKECWDLNLENRPTFVYIQNCLNRLQR